MKRLHLAAAFATAALLSFVPAPAPADGPGTQYCFGIGCPCGNDDPTGGCANATGVGALLDVTGSASVSADDAVFVGTRLPLNSVCLLLIGDAPQELPFKDGKLCVGGKIGRLAEHQNTGKNGIVRFEEVVQGFADQNRAIDAGDTVYFQLWFRDAPAKDSPCGWKSNTSNAYEITFVP